MTDIPELSAAPDAPSASDDAATFNAKAFPFAAYIEGLGDELNAYTAAQNVWAATILQALFTATSTTSNTIASSGTKNFTVQTGKSFAGGQFILAARTSAPGNYMRGQVSSYNADTGALVMAVSGSAGSGSGITDWTISLLPDGNALAKSGDTMAGKLGLVASAAGGASLNIAPGSAPSAPDNGDEWATSAGRFAKMNGATRQYVFADGLHEIPVPATSLTRRTTNGPGIGSSETTTNKIMVETLDFDASTAEYAQLRFLLPKRWNAGTVRARYVWTASATGNVAWACRAVAISNDDPMDSAWGTAQSVVDGVTAAGDLMVSDWTDPITIGGTPAKGDLAIFEFFRDAAVAGDTLAADAKLIGIVIQIASDAADDS